MVCAKSRKTHSLTDNILFGRILMTTQWPGSVKHQKWQVVYRCCHIYHCPDIQRLGMHVIWIFFVSVNDFCTQITLQVIAGHTDLPCWPKKAVLYESDYFVRCVLYTRRWTLEQCTFLTANIYPHFTNVTAPYNSFYNTIFEEKKK